MLMAISNDDYLENTVYVYFPHFGPSCKFFLKVQFGKYFIIVLHLL